MTPGLNSGHTLITVLSKILPTFTLSGRCYSGQILLFSTTFYLEVESLASLDYKEEFEDFRSKAEGR